MSFIRPHKSEVLPPIFKAAIRVNKITSIAQLRGAMQAKVAGLEAQTERQDYLIAGLEAQTERQDYLIAELRHALYGKRSEQLPPDERQLAFEYLETAVAETEAARAALAERNADGRPRRPPAKRNLGHLPPFPCASPQEGRTGYASLVHVCSYRHYF